MDRTPVSTCQPTLARTTGRSPTRVDLLIQLTYLFSEGEEYFIMLETPTLEHLQLCISTLQNSVKIAPTLDRDVKVLQTTVGTQKFDLSSDFFRVTKDDLKTEQKRKAEEMDKNSQLRTKSMRDRDAGIGMRIYFYTIIRIRFPDGLYLQGE